MKNRSVPIDVILPHLVYRNVGEAIQWLTATLGFVEHFRYGGDPPAGAQMHFGDAWIMLTSARPGRESPVNAGHWTQSLSIFVDDVEAHYARIKSTNAKIVEDLNETGYGEKQFGVQDPEGHFWLFSQHVKDLSPTDWGAQLTK